MTDAQAVAGTRPATAVAAKPPSDTRRMLDACRVRQDRCGNGKLRCTSPDRRPILGLPGYVDLWPCHQCDNCAERRRWNRHFERRANAIAECKLADQNWFDTITWRRGDLDLRRLLMDRGTIPEDAPEWTPSESERWRRKAAADKMKRLRRQGGPKVRNGTGWERGAQSGHYHAHRLLHAKGKLGWRRICCAGYIWPARFRAPKRRKGENDTQWGDRIIWGDRSTPTRRNTTIARRQRIIRGEEPWTPNDGLATGAKRWLAIRDDPTPEARIERLRLPMQIGWHNCTQVGNAGQASAYAAKAARYAAKGNGEWFASPCYGTGQPRRASDSDATAQGRNTGAGNPPVGTPSHTVTASGVDDPHYCQEKGHFVPQDHPLRPQPTAPPRPLLPLGASRWHQPHGPVEIYPRNE